MRFLLLIPLLPVLTGIGPSIAAKPKTREKPETREKPSAAKSYTLKRPIDPYQQLGVAWGESSHWAQPWRAYLETVPATVFLDGAGVNYDALGNPDLVIRMLASHGIHHLRIEIGWGNLNYDHPDELNNAALLRATLRAAKRYGCRPLILLNAHQGAPCPARYFDRVVTAAAPAGSRTVQLDRADDLKIGYSGLSQLTDYWAAEAIITAIDPATRTVILSKPLTKPLPAGAKVSMATLRYRPFEPTTLPGGAPNPAYQETLAGWDQYVLTVAHFVKETLDTAGPALPGYAISFPNANSSLDTGFDMEVWNELTFGDHYLYINDYYKPPLYPGYDGNIIWARLVQETARVMESQPDLFRNVALGDGFANTIPWPASSTEPLRVTAIDKHPYAGRKTFPRDRGHNTPLNALFEKDTSVWIPGYTELFPEYFASSIQTETIIREMSPFPTSIGNVMHGRNARPGSRPAPCSTWITEVNLGPVEDNPKVTSEEALAIKAKTTARYLCFFLNKGVTRLDFYDVANGDRDLGLVQDNFLKLAVAPNAAYPAIDEPYTSPALKVTAAIAGELRRGLDPLLSRSTVHPIALLSVTDSGGVEFAGDPATAQLSPNPHPPLHDADVFAFLPFQVNARRYVVAYYLVTRDVMRVYHPESRGAARYEAPVVPFRIRIGGIPGRRTAWKVLDPIHGQTVAARILSRSADSLELQLPTTDYPYLLELTVAPGRRSEDSRRVKRATVKIH